MKIGRPFRKTRDLELATSSIFKPYHFFCYHVFPPRLFKDFSNHLLPCRQRVRCAPSRFTLHSSGVLFGRHPPAADQRSYREPPPPTSHSTVRKPPAIFMLIWRSVCPDLSPDPLWRRFLWWFLGSFVWLVLNALMVNRSFLSVVLTFALPSIFAICIPRASFKQSRVCGPHSIHDWANDSHHVEFANRDNIIKSTFIFSKIFWIEYHLDKLEAF